MPQTFQAPDGQWTTGTAMYRDIQAWAQGSSLAPVRALSVDRNPELERVLLDRWPDLQITHAVHPEIDCQHLPFPGGSFDLVFSDQVIEHVPEPWRVATECERVLKPGGIGIHTSCAFNPRHGPPAFEDYYRFLPAGLAALFQSSSVERLGEWGSREALLHHLEADESIAPQIARSFSPEVGERTDGRYPWVTWIITRLCSETVPLWEIEAENLWSEVASEGIRQEMGSLLESLTLDPLVTPRILDRMGRPDPRTGKPYIDGRMLLFWLAQRIRPTHVLEVGVRRGFSLAAVSRAVPEANLIGFDQWLKDYGGVENPGPHFVLEELSRLGHKGPVHLVSGDSHQALPAFFAGKVNLADGHTLEPPAAFQLINIDGDHSIAGSWADLLDVVDKVAPGGALVFDDLNVDYIPEGDFRVGQYGVWMAFKRRYADQFHFLEYLDSIPGLGLAIRFPEPRPERRILLNTQVGPDEVPSPQVEPEQAEMDLVRELVKPGMTAFDIGAHIGKYTKLFAHLVGPEGRVHAFEPTPTTFKRLQGCWGSEIPSQVTLVPKLVTMRPGIFPFHMFPEQYSTWNSLGKPQMADPQAQDRLVPIAKQISVPGTSLDAYCVLQGITEIDYLKLDVEGAESEALGGMEGLLSRQAIRFLQFEISQKPLEGMGHQARETFAMLAWHGYACRPIEAGGRLGPVVFDSDAFYANYLAHKPGDPALEHLIRPTPIHFFTIVLNGKPFIEYHIRELTKLRVPWHWHIVEGLAEQRHDSSWMLSSGGRIEDSLHRNGLSHDGTTAYLDALARTLPDHVTVYRKPPDQFWEGKLEMVNAPLANIHEACLLWQVDADELWTAEQIHDAHAMFEAEPHRRCAVYRCHFFVGPSLVISTQNTYGNPTNRTAWNRTWRYLPGCRWKSHSPPILVEFRDGSWKDLYEDAPFLHDETEDRGLVFQHYAYADESQLAFKEIYYGYAGAVLGWRNLQQCSAFPTKLGNYFPWVDDEAMVEPAMNLGISPLAVRDQSGDWYFQDGDPVDKKKSKGVRIAGETSDGHDLTAVSGDSEFARSIRELFSNHPPKRLLETGTYLGQGTTATIARTLEELELTDAKFLSLEVNPSNHRAAQSNLTNLGLSHRVQLVQALSVPRPMLPTLDQIDEWTRRNIAYDDIFVDHAEHERAKLYFQETDFASVPDDGLRKALRALEWRPDFVLLDSGGHMGNVEFNYLLELLEGPCFIALDDVFHIKHRRSLEQIQTDPRFELLTLSREKFGFCIARFDPGVVPAKPLAEHILWVRLDAIGDNILAASMLEPLRTKFPEARISVLCQPHVAELYEACPFVNDVFTVDKQRAREDSNHLKSLMLDLSGLGIDLCLHSTYSREPLADALASTTGALRSIAHDGDDHNRDPKDRNRLNALYSDLVPSREEWGLELDRHAAFLDYMGIPASDLKPMAWVTPDDESSLEERLLREGLQDRELLALFPGAQWDARVYHGYSQALAPILRDHPLHAVVVIGSEKERDLGQQILDDLRCHGVNLCGQLSLRQCAALLRKSHIGVGAETGLAHLACAMGLPHVVILGGGHFGRFMPYSPLTTCAILPLGCFLCDWSCPYERPHCVKDLAPAVVESAIRATLLQPSDLPRLVAQESWKRPWDGPDVIDLGESLDLAQVQLETVPVSESGVGPLLSMVVPSVGRPQRLSAMLQSAQDCLGELPWELIGICPRADEETRAVFRQYGAEILLADEDHLGMDGQFSWSVLMNAGFSAARGKWVMYGSDDLLFEPESLPRLLAYAEMAGTRIGGVSMVEHNPSWKGYPDWWAPMGEDGWLMINFGVVRRSAWEAVGGFFPGFHFYGADWDLCYRIHANGWEILPVWDAQVRHHQEGDTVKKLHEERWQADKDLMEARSHLRPRPQSTQSTRIRFIERNGARTFALKALPGQMKSQVTLAPGPFFNRLDRWLGLAPGSGYLWALKAALLAHAGGPPEDLQEARERASAAGWAESASAFTKREDLGKTRDIPPPRTTVICAVWHQDPDRHELLKGHQASLDAQLVPVERIYVFDGGDQPPPWLKGRRIVRPEGLSIYEAWALALEAAGTPYVANLNLDDRLNPDAVAIFEHVLDEGTDLVGGDWQICFSQAETDAVTRSQEARVLPFDPAWPPRPGKSVRLGSGLGERDTLGPACAWRRELHRQIRPFPTRFGDGSPVRVIGDALWWRLVSGAGMIIKRLPLLLGRYHSHPEGQAEFRTPAEAEEELFQRHGLG